MPDVGEVPQKEIKKEKVYPSLNLSTEQLPELRSKKLGDSVELRIKGKIAGAREDYDNKKEFSYDVKVMECEIMGKIDRDEYLNLSDKEKDKVDEEDVLKEEKEEMGEK